MKLQEIKNVFLNKKGEVENNVLKASVLVPLIEIEGKLNILFEVRAKDLDVQPGEISFPGGGVESGECYTDTVIRETVEELGVMSKDIEIYGELDYLVTSYNLIIYPFIGRLKNINKIKNINFNKSEVGSIFTVPLDYLYNYNPDMYKAKTKTEPQCNFPYHLIQNGKDYKWRTGEYGIYFYKYQNYVIWGITASIIKKFIDEMK